MVDDETVVDDDSLTDDKASDDGNTEKTYESEAIEPNDSQVRQ
jgi:hypothetical protein